jgi:hypothetical protein
MPRFGLGYLREETKVRSAAIPLTPRPKAKRYLHPLSSGPRLIPLNASSAQHIERYLKYAIARTHDRRARPLVGGSNASDSRLGE